MEAALPFAFGHHRGERTLLVRALLGVVENLVAGLAHDIFECGIKFIKKHLVAGDNYFIRRYDQRREGQRIKNLHPPIDFPEKLLVHVSLNPVSGKRPPGEFELRPPLLRVPSSK